MRLVRAFNLGGFQLSDEDADGRTVVGRIVPYNEVAHVVEPDESGKIVEYDEAFPPASLTKMMQGAGARGNDYRFIRFTLDHEPSFDHRIGFATGLESRDDGAWATFRLYESNDLPKVRSMLTESHTGLSVEFFATRSRTRDDGVIERLGAHIHTVTATPSPMYAGATIAAMRGEDVPAVGTPHLDELRAYLANGCK